MADVAASPASFQPSKAAIMIGSRSSRTSSSSINTASWCVVAGVPAATVPRPG